MTPKELRSRRLALALSVADLAREFGMAVERLREMESGDAPLTEHALMERTFAKLEARKRAPRQTTGEKKK
jgi:transcriptional regulator with XRE-family HTH domain